MLPLPFAMEAMTTPPEIIIKPTESRELTNGIAKLTAAKPKCPTPTLKKIPSIIIWKLTINIPMILGNAKCK